jgi:inosine-uridine nucleoside N-ribohydrolase
MFSSVLPRVRPSDQQRHRLTTLDTVDRSWMMCRDVGSRLTLANPAPLARMGGTMASNIRPATVLERVRIAWVAVLLIAVAGCNASEVSPIAAGTASTAPTGTLEAASPTGPTPVLIDTDLSADDTLALPFLLREPSLDVAAVTVVGTGLVHCAQGLEHLTALLTTLQVGELPISCGRSEPLSGSHAFPPEWRAGADAGYGLSLDPRPVSVPSQSAPELIRSVAAASTRPITIVALGPMTNLAEAFGADAALADHVARIVAMGGAVDVPGNVDLGSGPTAAEWNVYADPAAFDAVLRAGVPITLVPLDATNDVPVNADFIAQLETDHEAAPADIAYELLVRGALTTFDSFWDPLAAVTAVDEGVVTLDTIPLRVVVDEGPDSGRLERSDGGIPVRVATSADRGAFESRLLSGLRVGASRANPFRVTGTMDLRFDGDTCVDERPETLAPGVWSIVGSSTTPGSTGFAIVLFHAGYGWDDLVDYVATRTDSTAQPAFVDVPGFAVTEGPGSATMIADLGPGTYGLVCLAVSDTGSRVVLASGPFTVAG